MRSETIAKAILADRGPKQTPVSKSILCFACGRSFTYRGPKEDDSGRFCNPVCRKAYDAGYKPEPPLDVFSVKWPPVRRKGKPKPANRDLIRPRRKCVVCGGNIPVWIKGRKVSKRRKKCLTCSG